MHISIPSITQISLKFVFGSKSKLYLSLFNSIFWRNGGAHPLSLHRTIIWVPACEILSHHFTALPSHHKTQWLISCLCTPQNPFHITQQETGFPPTFATVSPWIFSLTHSTYFLSSLFQISDFFFLLSTDQKPHIQSLF